MVLLDDKAIGHAPLLPARDQLRVRGAELSPSGQTALVHFLDETLSSLFDGDLLAIYLQDHLAGSTFGSELVRRARDANAGTEVGDFLAGLADDIAQDREALLALMAQLGVQEDRLKSGLAWTAEKAGRLKLNGRLTSYSPLSRVVELEGLIGGVTTKLSGWYALCVVAEHDTRLDREELDRLIARAQSQLEGLREHHRAACALALAER